MHAHEACAEEMTTPESLSDFQRRLFGVVDRILESVAGSCGIDGVVCERISHSLDVFDASVASIVASIVADDSNENRAESPSLIDAPASPLVSAATTVEKEKATPAGSALANTAAEIKTTVEKRVNVLKNVAALFSSLASSLLEAKEKVSAAEAFSAIASGLLAAAAAKTVETSPCLDSSTPAVSAWAKTAAKIKAADEEYATALKRATALNEEHVDETSERAVKRHRSEACAVTSALLAASEKVSAAETEHAEAIQHAYELASAAGDVPGPLAAAMSVASSTLVSSAEEVDAIVDPILRAASACVSRRKRVFFDVPADDDDEVPTEVETDTEVEVAE